jgi:excisionase family DNA binding protein
MAGIVRIVTVKEVAEFLRLKEATICRLASEGKLPGVKVGKSWRFDMEALERWVTGAQAGVIDRTAAETQEFRK